MISENLDNMPGLGEIVPILREGVHNGIEFLVVDIPIFLGGMEFVVEEEERMPSVVIFLFENAGIGLVGGVRGEANRFTRLEGANVDVIADVGKNAVKGRLMDGGPFPWLVLFGEIGKACGDVGIMRDEFIVETDHAKEGTEVGKTSGRGKITDTLNLVCGHADSFSTDDVEAKEIALLGEPFAFVGLKAKTIIPEGFENESNMLLVSFERAFGVDDDVVEVSVAEDSEVGVEDGVDKTLENGGSGGESHRHDGVLKGAKKGFKGGRFFGTGGHSEVGETRAHIHRCDPVGACEVIHQGAGQGDWVFIEDDLAIEISVVDDESELARAAAGGGVANEEDRGGGFGFGRLDETSLDLEVEKGLKLLELFLGHIIEFARLKFGSFTELDRAVVVWAIWGKFVGGFVGEDCISKVTEFPGDCLKPAFFVSCESSDPWVIGSYSGGCPYLGGVVMMFDGKVDLGADVETCDILLL